MSKTLTWISLALISTSLLTGCAAGAATAGYSLKAQTADNLTSDAEQRIVDRTKREIFSELEASRLQSLKTQDME